MSLRQYYTRCYKVCKAGVIGTIDGIFELNWYVSQFCILIAGC